MRMSYNFPRLLGSTEDGEGRVTFPAKFLTLNPLLRADLLKDWLFELETEYNRAVESMNQPSDSENNVTLSIN